MALWWINEIYVHTYILIHFIDPFSARLQMQFLPPYQNRTLDRTDRKPTNYTPRNCVLQFYLLLTLKFGSTFTSPNCFLMSFVNLFNNLKLKFLLGCKLQSVTKLVLILDFQLIRAEHTNILVLIPNNSAAITTD